MATKREFLFSLGLTAAPTGRGRFSREALAAIDKALAEGTTFDDVVVSEPKVKTIKSEPKVRPDKIDPNSYSPAAVREWAAGQGIVVGARGRIDSAIVRQYLDSADNIQARDTTPANFFGPTPSRIRGLDNFTFSDGTETIRKTYKDTCASCRYSLGWCPCPTPTAWSQVDTSRSLPLVR